MSLSKHLPLISFIDYSSLWDWEWFQVYLLEWLHLVALGDRFGYGFLITLGGCHHLDGLEQRRSMWHELMIVRGHLTVIVRGLVPSPTESRKVTLVDCSCHWVTSLVGWFLRCPSEDEVHATPLSRRTTKCWSTQQGRSVSASTWTLGENCVSLLWLFIGFVPVIGLHIIDWFISSTRRYKDQTISFYIPVN